MSSVTSTREAAASGVSIKSNAGVRDASSPATEGFQPWHFFVLASLLLATVAVVMSRQSTPAHLILISFTIGAAGAAAAGFYRMLAPLASADAAQFRAPLTARSREALEREKTLVLRSIKELEFDRAMRKLSDRDFEEMGGRLRARAIALMKQLDDGGSGYRTLIEKELKARLAGDTQGGHSRVSVPMSAGGHGDSREGQPDAAVAGQICAACGTAGDGDARFCKNCGARLAEGVRS
jgi:hypothetical protein